MKGGFISNFIQYPIHSHHEDLTQKGFPHPSIQKNQKQPVDGMFRQLAAILKVNFQKA